ncbi:MAG: hypothetical protein QNK37_15890 [Acidobacteriota bacterium]|nr:hypothetical protein [Acidobacteriota bacterium]
MNKAADTAQLDLTTVSEMAQDFKLLQARHSKKFVALMVDICTAVNACPMGKLKNLDIEELKSQTGHMIYFDIKGLDEAIPCDLEFVPQLNSHFRKPTIIVLKRIRKFLMAEHRRILGRLEREQAFERILNMSAFDVSHKIRNALNEINRYQDMAKMVRGGGRKLDILMAALNVPSRCRFELVTIDRIVRDVHHQRHGEAKEWLNNSKFKGNTQAIHGLIKNGFQMLDSASNKILDLMEELSGIQFSRDSSTIDLHRNWYALGNSLPRGEEFIKSFTEEEKVEQKIKRLTYPMVRVGWDADRLRNRMDRLIVDLNNPKILATQLSNLFFDIEDKIDSSTKPDGPVMTAIETDMENGMLSIRERDQAEKWIRENKIKLQDLMMEIYDQLKELKEKNPKLGLADKLESTLERIKSGQEGDRDAQVQDVESEVEKLTAVDFTDKIAELEKSLENPDGKLLQEICDTRKAIKAQIDRISIKNIDFHKKVRDAYTDFKDYEDKVMELYGQEEKLQNQRIQVEGWLLDCYRVCTYEGVADKTLTACMEVVIETMLLAVKKLEYEVIDASVFESYFEEALKMESVECMLHLDQLLQEIGAVPRAEQLINALKDWEKDIGKDKVKEKETFILENNEKLQEIADKIRAEMRERINESGATTRRMRFDVFGLSDSLAENLTALLHGLMATVDKVANEQEGELLIKSLESLEAQILQAQKDTKPGGEAIDKLKRLAEKDQISPDLTKDLKRDLEQNFSELDVVLEETSSGLKRVKLLQNRFGAEKETDYLDVTLNINDLERLSNVYDFLENITMEDSKRFCVAYNLKTGLVNNLFERAQKKDPTLSKEILSQFNRKTYKLFREKRYIPLPLKTAIMVNSKDIFEAECQLLCHTLNLVRPYNIRKKAAYQSMLGLLAQAKDADHQGKCAMGLLFGRLQSRMFDFKPKNHEKNFEGNRQSLLTDVKEAVGDAFKR